MALGPTGANSDGALTDLLETTAENFGGQGEQFNQTIHDLSKFTQTLDNNKEELFGTARELERFISTLAENDQTVRDFNQSLADVATMLEGERDELTASLKQPRPSRWARCRRSSRRTATSLGRNIKGLNRVAKVLVKQRGRPRRDPQRTLRSR